MNSLSKAPDSCRFPSAAARRFSLLFRFRFPPIISSQTLPVSPEPQFRPELFVSTGEFQCKAVHCRRALGDGEPEAAAVRVAISFCDDFRNIFIAKESRAYRGTHVLCITRRGTLSRRARGSRCGTHLQSSRSHRSRVPLQGCPPECPPVPPTQTQTPRPARPR